MDDRRFDSLVRSLAAGRSRREILKGVLGLGGAAVVGAAVASNHAEAARRGFSGPRFPTPCVPQCDGATCGGDGCGGTCGDCLGGQTCFEGVCFNSCDPNGGPGCCSACQCDAVNFVCVTKDDVGTNCASTGCPAGWFCDQSNVCRTACACGA
jgi:hypothetical protein